MTLNKPDLTRGALIEAAGTTRQCYAAFVRPSLGGFTSIAAGPHGVDRWRRYCAADAFRLAVAAELLRHGCGYAGAVKAVVHHVDPILYAPMHLGFDLAASVLRSTAMLDRRLFVGNGQASAQPFPGTTHVIPLREIAADVVGRLEVSAAGPQPLPHAGHARVPSRPVGSRGHAAADALFTKEANSL